MTGAAFSATSLAWMHLTRWFSKMGRGLSFKIIVRVINEGALYLLREEWSYRKRSIQGSVLFEGHILIDEIWYVKFYEAVSQIVNSSHQYMTHSAAAIRAAKSQQVQGGGGGGLVKPGK